MNNLIFDNLGSLSFSNSSLIGVEETLEEEDFVISKNEVVDK